MGKSEAKTVTAMKRIFFILSLFVCGIAAAQIQQVAEAPKWFFQPPAGEYVGVSLPLKDQDLAKKQAVYTALLSYMAQHDIEGKLSTNRSVKGLVINEEGITRTRDQTNEAGFLRLSLPGSYEITKTSKNKYGEVFVAISILPSNKLIETLFKSSVEYDTESTDNTNRYNYSCVSSFALLDSANFSLTATVDERFTDDIEDIKIDVNVTDIISRSDETCKLTGVSSYRYSPTAKFKKNTLSPVSSQTVRQSLGAAYLRVLLQLLSAEEYWITDNTVSDNTQNPASEMPNVMDFIKRNSTPIGSASIFHDDLFLHPDNR
jgi:hypothetical protein